GELLEVGPRFCLPVELGVDDGEPGAPTGQPRIAACELPGGGLHLRQQAPPPVVQEELGAETDARSLARTSPAALERLFHEGLAFVEAAFQEGDHGLEAEDLPAVEGLAELLGEGGPGVHAGVDGRPVATLQLGNQLEVPAPARRLPVPALLRAAQDLLSRRKA